MAALKFFAYRNRRPFDGSKDSFVQGSALTGAS